MAGLLAAFKASLATPEPRIPFAEDLFPELHSLMGSAVREAPEVRMAELRLEEGAGIRDLAFARENLRIWSTARIAASYEMREDIDDDFEGDYYFNLTASKPLYEWGNIKRRKAIAEKHFAARNLDYRQQLAGELMDLRRAYLKWLLMSERKRVLEQSVGALESLVGAQRELAEAGRTAEQEVLALETRLLENREALAWVDNAQRREMRQMEILTGRRPGELNLKAASLSVIEPIDLDALEEMADLVQSKGGGLEETGLKRLKLLEEAESEQLAVLDKANWPTVNFVTGVNSDRLDSINRIESVERVRFFAGLQVDWNLFDGWQAKARKRSVYARKRMHALSQDQVEAEVSRETESLLSEIEYLIKQTEARMKRQKLLEQRLQLIKEQSERDLIPASTLFEAEGDLLDISQRVMESRVHYFLNLMELGKRLGLDPAAGHYATDP